MFTYKDYIYSIYECGSLTKAAEQLFVTQPTLSIALKKTEKRIGHPLFERGVTPLALTKVGEEYINAVRHLRNIEEQFQMYCNAFDDPNTGYVKIAAASFLVRHVLSSLLHQFSMDYPNIKMEIFEYSPTYLVDALKTKLADLIIDSADPPPSFEATLLFKEVLLLGVPLEWVQNTPLMKYAYTSTDIRNNRHLQKDSPRADISCFADRRFALQNDQQDIGNRSLRICSAAGFTPDATVHVDQSVTAYHFIVHRTCAAFIPDTHIRIRQYKDNVAFFYPDSPDCVRPVWILHEKTEYLSGATKLLIRILTEYFSDLRLLHD